MIRINQLKLPIGHTTAALEKKIQKALYLQNQHFTYQIRSLWMQDIKKTKNLFIP